MRGSRLPRKIPARRKAAATRLQSAWRARPARRQFLTVRAAALKVQVAWLARRRARFAAASRLQRTLLWLGMSSAARKQACEEAITLNYAKLREDGGGFCVYCCEPSPVEEMEKMGGVGDLGDSAAAYGCNDWGASSFTDADNEFADKDGDGQPDGFQNKGKDAASQAGHVDQYTFGDAMADKAAAAVEEAKKKKKRFDEAKKAARGF